MLVVASSELVGKLRTSFVKHLAAEIALQVGLQELAVAEVVGRRTGLKTAREAVALLFGLRWEKAAATAGSSSVAMQNNDADLGRQCQMHPCQHRSAGSLQEARHPVTRRAISNTLSDAGQV